MSGRKVYVGQLSFKTTERNLRDFLSDCGELEEVVIITDRETGDSRGFGFATFTDQDAAEEACRRSGEELDGREIIINYARDRGDRGGRDRGYNRGYGRGGGGGYGRDRGGYDRNRSGYGRDRDGYGRDRGGYGRDREDRDDGGRRQY